MKPTYAEYRVIKHTPETENLAHKIATLLVDNAATYAAAVDALDLARDILLEKARPTLAEGIGEDQSWTI